MITEFNLDVLQALLWILTYITIIIIGIKNKSMIMPIPALLLNFGWEITAIILHGNLIQWAWGLTDLLMFYIYLFLQNKSVNNKKKRLWCFPVLIIFILIFYSIFRSSALGMLISCFVVDFIMAICFLIYLVFKPQYGYSMIVGVLKLSGDLCAWLYYRSNHIIIDIIGVLVLICNILYIIYVFKITFYGIKSSNPL